MTVDRDRIRDSLESYEVGEELGRGAWGVVLAGRHLQLDRKVAIKQLSTALGDDPHTSARFAAEARLIASLDHPHIVPIYDYREREGLYLIVMEYLSGGTLWQRFTQRGLATDEAVAVVLAACTALQYAHERGILHRDVKPENVMLTDTGIPKLADFGIAKLLSGTRTALTAAGAVIGTPAYMAPEQIQGGELGPATDVYAMGIVLYELLSGALPFPEVTDPVAQLYQHVHEAPRPLAAAAPTVPDAVTEALMRALEKDPARRHPSAEAFGVALAEGATAAWGPGWLRRTALRVIPAGEIVAATERTAAPVERPAATVVIRGAPDAHPYLAPGPESAPTAAASTSTPAPPGGTAAPVPPPPPVGPPPYAPPPTQKRRRATVAALGGAAVVIVGVVVGAFALLGGGGDGDDEAADTAATEDQTVDEEAPPPRRDPGGAPALGPTGRAVQIDDIRIAAGRYIVDYTSFGFVPLISEDPSHFHVHFFWSPTYLAEEAGSNAAEFGAEIGEWELWDRPVFDAFRPADRPSDANGICAVVADFEHGVDDPGAASCIDLPDA